MKNWNFILLPNETSFDYEFNLTNNPYSSISGSLLRAKGWAKMLLEIHKEKTIVQFRSYNGRKTYSVTR